MAIAAGRLRHRVVIQRQVETQDSTTGAIDVIWQDLATVWAAIEPMSAREFIAAQSEASKITTRITIRYRSDITAKMRLYHQHKGMYYNIEGALSDKDSGLEYLTLPCSEGIRYIQSELPPPVNLTIPVITGTLQVGQTISVSTGLWANNPTSYSYQWHRGDGEEITGATNNTYLLTLAEAEIDVYCTVTAINDSGSASQNTADTAPIAP